MRAAYEYFVLFAEMRTGSNFLEANLNSFEAVECLGELFNPHFIGFPKANDALGISREERDANPKKLLTAIKKKTHGIGGFRYFHDHDPRVLDEIIDDPSCAKIVLTRHPVQTYVSLKLAEQTGQWKLTNVAKRKAGAVRFDAQEFEQHRSEMAAFHATLMNRLQHSGQTAFCVDYDDLQNLDVINGLAAFLGLSERLEAVATSTKLQNSTSLADKVENAGAMAEALSHYDWFDLEKRPDFEPERSAAVRDYVVQHDASLVFLPVHASANDAVCAWLSALSAAEDTVLESGLTQKQLRQWKRKNSGHRSFTVLRHPVARVFSAFCDKLLPESDQANARMIDILRDRHGVPLITGLQGEENTDRLKLAFCAFLNWLPEALNGQTALKIDAYWASQSRILQGFSRFSSPDFVAREDTLHTDLKVIATSVGKTAPPYRGSDDDHAIERLLTSIYDSSIEQAVRNAYARDYMMFGFKDWAPSVTAEA